MRTLAEALAEREFYARSAAPALPAGPSRREKGRKRVSERLSVLTGFNPPRYGAGTILKAPDSDPVQVYHPDATNASMLQEAAQ